MNDPAKCEGSGVIFWINVNSAIPLIGVLFLERYVKSKFHHQQQKGHSKQIQKVIAILAIAPLVFVFFWQHPRNQPHTHFL